MTLTWGSARWISYEPDTHDDLLVRTKTLNVHFMHIGKDMLYTMSCTHVHTQAISQYQVRGLRTHILGCTDLESLYLKYRLAKMRVRTCNWNSSGLDEVTTSALFTVLYGLM